MPYKDKQKHKEYYKKWRENNEDHIKEYNQTAMRKKSNKISDWKYKGIKTDDYYFLYDWYKSIDTCLNCDVQLISGRGLCNHKHLDHDHITGEPTMIVCGYCNVHILK